MLIGKTKSAAFGAGALFAFSLGLGFPFWLVGTFAVSLPKGGRWMVYVKSLFGIVLATAALYFLRGAVPFLAHLGGTDSIVAIGAALLLAFGIAIGAVHLSFDQGVRARVRKGIGIVASTAGLFLLVAWALAPRGKLSWLDSEPTARAQAETERRPMLLDFTAEWCGACNELSRITFADPRVMSEASRFVAVKVDATHDDDPATDVVKDRYGVVGLPTVILVGSDGHERTRFTEFVEPERFLTAIREID